MRRWLIFSVLIIGLCYLAFFRAKSRDDINISVVGYSATSVPEYHHPDGSIATQMTFPCDMAEYTALVFDEEVMSLVCLYCDHRVSNTFLVKDEGVGVFHFDCGVANGWKPSLYPHLTMAEMEGVKNPPTGLTVFVSPNYLMEYDGAVWRRK